MSTVKPWDDYVQIAERTINRCNMTDPHGQTVHYVAIILWTESKLADLERAVADISTINPLHWGRLLRAQREYSQIASTVHNIQKTTSKPDSYLHDLIQVDKSEVENKAVSEIMTQLGWEYFPRHLNRFLNLYERVGRGLDSKKQQLLTTGIILVSFVAILISAFTLVVSIMIP